MQYFINQGGPNKNGASFGEAYPKLLPSRCMQMTAASHTGKRLHSDLISVDTANEAMLCHLGSNGGLAVDDEIYANLMPIGFYMDAVTVMLNKPHIGFDFDVELVGIKDLDLSPSQIRSCGLKCGAPGGPCLVGEPDTDDVTPLFSVVGEYEKGDPCDMKFFPFEFARDAEASFMHYNHVLRLKVTAVPEGGVLSSEECKDSLIPCFGISAMYRDPCFRNSEFWGDCAASGTCG